MRINKWIPMVLAIKSRIIMKLRQNLFLKKFLLVWGIIGMLFPFVVLIIFELKGILAFLMLLGMSLSCILLSATIGWEYCSKPHWIPLSISMSVAFCVVVAIMTVIVVRGCIWGVIMLLMYLFPMLILPCTLLIFFVNYLMLNIVTRSKLNLD